MSRELTSTKIGISALIALVFLVGLTVISIVMYPKYAFETFEIILSESDVNSYSDKRDNGNSTIEIIDDDESSGFDCMIKEGNPYPFCITKIHFTELVNKGLDFSKFHKMRIYGTYSPPKKTDFLRISFLNYNSDYSTSGQQHTYKYNLIELQSQTLQFPIELNMSDLNVPLWWASNMRRKNVNTQIDLTNVPTIELATGTDASKGEHNLRVNKFEFEAMIITINQLYEYIFIIWGGLLFLFVSITMVILLINLKKTKRSELNLLAINDVLSVKSAELELISKHDELTGLLNRTGLKNKMIDCLEKKQYPLTVVMIDVDFFKKINDTFGHQKGDVVLSTLGKILRDFTQDDESVSRFGGEEFIVLMPEKAVDDVMNRLDRLRQQIQDTDMDIDQRVTASFGLACSHKYSGIKNLIDCADAALYKAKEEGRNCIRVSH